MQMSIERFREVHKLIWNTVIEHIQEVRERGAYINAFKEEGLYTAYRNGLLELDELMLIERNGCCLLCASCPTCWSCVLGRCGKSDSLYSRACHGDKDAMIKIRDIVDKKPFTESYIITLYDVEDF